jgi:hypothetical protein
MAVGLSVLGLLLLVGVRGPVRDEQLSTRTRRSPNFRKQSFPADRFFGGYHGSHARGAVFADRVQHLIRMEVRRIELEK